MILERLTPSHIMAINLQPAQQFALGLLTPEYASQIVEQRGVGWTAMHEGRPIACAGIVEAWEGRGLAWALFSEQALRHFTSIHRAARNVLADAPWRRIEMTVDATHEQGIRWAQRLGFEQEGLMRSYTRDGRDCYLFARLK